MDCQTALEILDGLPASSLIEFEQTADTTGDHPEGEVADAVHGVSASAMAADSEQPGLSEALAHVRQHPDCAAILRQRQQFDVRIAQAMQDVAVPDGLKERLLGALAGAGRSSLDERSAESSDVAAAVSGDMPGTEHSGQQPVDESPAMPAAEPARKRFSRRVWIRASLATLAGVAVVLFGWLLRPTAVPSFTMEEIVQRAPWKPAELAALPDFDQSFAAELPLEWQYGRMAIAPARGAALTTEPDADSPHTLAAYAFRMPLSRRPAVTGTLLVLPLSAVSNLPAARSFQSGGYARTTGGDGAVKVWRSESHVYVCLVHGGVDALEQLQRALEPTAV